MLDKYITSRYGIKREIKQVSENQISIDVSDSHFTRGGTHAEVNEDNEIVERQYLDFEGGPFISEGEELKFLGLKDKFIKTMTLKNGILFIDY